MNRIDQLPVCTAEEIVEIIPNGATIAASGFAPAGCPKLVPEALAQRARDYHNKGAEYKIRLVTGAGSDSRMIDSLAKANAISWLAPYQNNKFAKSKINSDEIDFTDIHLSRVPGYIENGFLGNIDFAIIEVSDVTKDGKIILTNSVGASPSFLRKADKVILELCSQHPERIQKIMDVYHASCQPNQGAIPLISPLKKIGKPYIKIDPKKIVGIVHSDEKTSDNRYMDRDSISDKIAENAVELFNIEMAAGRIPKNFLPVQAGIGSTSNAVMAALGSNPQIPPFYMYSEVIQDSQIGLLLNGEMAGASGTSLNVSKDVLKTVYDNMDFFSSKLILRPQDITNDPGVIRRLKVITINVAIEVDIYGNVNSSHFFGTNIMSGIGGSADFTHNGYLSIMLCPSTGKGGAISRFVPMVTHVDNTEHSIDIVISEHGFADLRGKSPSKRAKEIIDNCVDPSYRELIFDYLKSSRKGHVSHNLSKCFDLHQKYLEHGTMLTE